MDARMNAFFVFLDSCESYEDRRKIRQRLKSITANAKGGSSSPGVVASKRAVRESSTTSSSSLRSEKGESLDLLVGDQLRASLSPLKSDLGKLANEPRKDCVD